MTTLPPQQPTSPATPVPVDPYPNKALAVLLTTIVGVVTQWLSTGHFSLGQEGATAIVGAVATLLVWAVSNFKRRGF
jgi:hypothetical protein